MTDQQKIKLLRSVLQELINTEAAYRSAMNIYANHPNHHTMIMAESRFWHAKSIARFVLANPNAKWSPPTDESTEPLLANQPRGAEGGTT